MSFNISLSTVQFFSSFFGKHEALLRFGVDDTPGLPQPKSDKKKRRLSPSNVSQGGINSLNDESKSMIRIFSDHQLDAFVDVDRSNGVFKIAHDAFGQIARFDSRTLPSDDHVMLSQVSYWTTWEEYVDCGLLIR